MKRKPAADAAMPATVRKIRAAVYTRKSSEEGLEQDFNSLDAQREACAAYVLSQASEGWQLLPDHYDDGGISGGTLERPALQRMLADMAKGRIDVVVVYKVDRLSRSLFDFAKLVEAFDRVGASFVSVTQSFNTTTSMGRLTLNMLLSFAQFEREVTAERIRDKLAASKAKGMWMGGTPPLGYKPDGRTLTIVEEHAALVRDIYRSYLQLGNVRLLAEQLKVAGIAAPCRTTSTGRAYGGKPFSRGQLYFMLKNPIYVGEIPHRDKTYPGNHPAIIERAMWDEVQQKLADHTQGIERARLPHRSLLAGLLIDAAGEPMSATHATKNNQRYRYYVSRSLQKGTGDDGMRLPAREIESAVKEHVARLFDDPLLLASQLALDISPNLLRQMTDRCGTIAHELRGRSGGRLTDIIARLRAREGKLAIEVAGDRLRELLGVTEQPGECPTLVIEVDFRLTRTGRTMRLVQSDGSPGSEAKPNEALVGLVVEARRLWNLLSTGDIDIATLAREEGRNDSYVTRILRAAFLSPEVTDAILAGRQHGALTARTLREMGGIPTPWEEQAKLFLPGHASR